MTTTFSHRFLELLDAAIARVFREARLAAGWRLCRRCGGRGHVWHVAGMYGSAYYPPPGPVETLREEVCPRHLRASERRALARERVETVDVTTVVEAAVQGCWSSPRIVAGLRRSKTRGSR